MAYCLEGSCSIQLSYGRILERVMGIEPTQPAWKAGILAIELHPHLPFLLTTVVLYQMILSLSTPFFQKNKFFIFGSNKTKGLLFTSKVPTRRRPDPRQ